MEDKNKAVEQGMSRDHAKKFVEQFEAMLKVAEGQAQSSEKKVKTN